MADTHYSLIADELHLSPQQVQATANLLDEGATVPFLARYRKEVTGSLDEVAITAIRDRLEQLRQLDDRRVAIQRSLTRQGKQTDELEARVLAAMSLSVLEDIYLPYKPKRRTRATIAKEKGLEPFAEWLFSQGDGDPSTEAQTYVDPEKRVNSADDALAGARDIIAERVNEDQQARASMRNLFIKQANVSTRVISGKEAEASKYRDYFDWQEPLATAPSHRILAMRRGEREEMLVMHVLPPEDTAQLILARQFITGKNAAAEQVRLAVQDSYKRLLAPSMETEIRLLSKRRADETAIDIFAENLRQLLLAAPLGRKNVLAIDPGFRTGCKVVCLDRQGKLVHNTTIYPNQSERDNAEVGEALLALCLRFSIEAIAIGNGTASRETEAFVQNAGLPKDIAVVMVNESGASIYSASASAREEFPSHDITVRGSVSIGRRLMDPLAELVKIDPKSIGVGQYQHDVDQVALKKRLDDVVMTSVNDVGVEVNTASKQLLSYVSGLGPQLAQNIVTHRNENGPFPSRTALKKVARLGPKAFEQAAGFLRIGDGNQPLDASAVHPESYPIVEAMARDIGCTVKDLLRDEQQRQKIALNKYVTNHVGLPTLHDIEAELVKPGRDPRGRFAGVRFAEGIEKLEDVKAGMKLPGVVTNITGFGAFVDIGVHQDGLVHISQLAEQFVKDANEIVKVQQKVKVTVLEVDAVRKRISLSMKEQKQ